jgi:hypothetical protein
MTACAHPSINLRLMGIRVSFQSRNEEFSARSRAISQYCDIGQPEAAPWARGIHAPSQIKGLRGDVHLVRRTSDPRLMQRLRKRANLWMETET